jgi:hypothetical protein
MLFVAAKLVVTPDDDDALVNELTAVLRLAIRFGNLGGGSDEGTAGGDDVNSNS